MGLDFYVFVDRDKAVCIDLKDYDGSDARWSVVTETKVPQRPRSTCTRLLLSPLKLFGKAEAEEALTTTHTSRRYVCDAVDTCDVCSAVLDAFAAADDDETFARDFSNTADYRSCGNYERFLKQLGHSEGQWCLSKNRKSLMGISLDSWHARNAEEYYATQRTGLVLVRMTYKDRSIGIGRALTSFIDLDIIRNWRDTCDRQHRERCAPHLIGLAPIQIPWFIDTYDQCIVSGSENQRYVALSYRWGVSGKAQLTTKTLQGLQKKGSLGSCGDSTLPKTILNAMDLCRAIGERYLWADTLCIPQDDDIVRQRMISNMTAVYANANMTIIAADGEHADHGLRGVPGEFQVPREPVKLFDGPLGGQFFRKPMKTLDETDWNSRGWTFQEYTFSPRRLIFIEDTVRWECCQACCWEEIEQPGEALRQISTAKSASTLQERRREETASYDSDLSDIRHAPILPLPLYPDLTLLGHLSSAYNRRNLSFDRDAHAAFAGILTAMNATFPGGFVWGIPVMFLDPVLTWSSRTGAEVKDLGQRSCLEDILPPPEWTWMGWQGPLADGAWDNIQYIYQSPDYPNQMHEWTVPITTWYTQEYKTSEQRQIPDQNKWYEYRKQFVGVVDPKLLPPGWTAHRISLSDTSSEEAAPGPSTDTGLGHTTTTVVYTHKDLGDSMRFWHPIPLRDPMGDTVSCTSEVSLPVESDGQYLVCKAEQAQLCTSSTRSMIPGHETNYKVPLTAMGSDQVICWMTPDSETYFWCRTITDVTVVAISGGYTASYPAVFDQERIGHYNVLCVSWIDGVAYRRGVGTIAEGIWESLERETVDLVLG